MQFESWKNTVLRSVAVGLLFLSSALVHADDASLLAQLRANLAEKPTAVHESLVPGLYGVYFSMNEPRTYADGHFRYFGNSSTGYTYLSGPRRGQDLALHESQQLFRDFLAAIPREKLIAYRFGSGKREVFLFSAYDCPSCRALELELAKQAKQLDATVYVIPTGLAYASIDVRAERAKTLVHGVLCAENQLAAWNALLLKGIAPPTANCAVNPDDYALLRRAFPVKVAPTVPTAVTSDGRIYPMVMAKFDEIFRGK